MRHAKQVKKLPILYSDFNTEDGKYVEEEIHLLPFYLNVWKYVVIRAPINVSCKSSSSLKKKSTMVLLNLFGN